MLSHVVPSALEKPNASLVRYEQIGLMCQRSQTRKKLGNSLYFQIQKILLDYSE